MVAIHRYDSDGTSGSESGDDTAPNNNNSNPNNPTNNNNLPPSSWRGWKERGKQAYLKGDYASALQNYSQALHRQNNLFHSNSQTQQSNTGGSMFPSRLDRQILLSNMVACRLKLGGAPQAEAAVANAQKCISIDPQWAKGHLRLAEAYLALGKSTGNHERRLASSNQACEALQKVIDLDPTNQAAHNLLTKEFRYSALHGERESRTAPEPSAPPEHMDENRSHSSNNNNNAHSPYQEESTRNNEEQHQQQQQQQEEEDNNTDGIDIEDDNNYVFAPSWQDRLEYGVQKVRAWYAGLSEDDKSLVKLGVLFVVLYVAFGGRFGLEYLGKNNTPPRRSSAVYDEFYQSRSRNRHRYDTATSYDRHGGRSYDSSSSGYHHSGHSSSSWLGSNSWGSSSRNCRSCFGGQYSYVLLVLGLSYVGQRFFGIGPYQVLFFVNMLTGRRNNRWFAPRRRYGWGQGWGQGMYFNNPRAQYRHPPRGMWG